MSRAISTGNWRGDFSTSSFRVWCSSTYADAPRAWSNVCALLAPGGVALAFHLMLYAPPFVVNWLAPEVLTAPILRFFFLRP